MNYAKLTEIFEAQKVLMHKYHDIEVSNGVPDVPIGPLDFNLRDRQMRFRLTTHWMIEECVEAVEADPENLASELSDILHFMTEAAIYAGVTPAHFQFHESRQSPNLMHLVIILGRATNLMKAKPWKQTLKPWTLQNQTLLERYVREAYEFLLEHISSQGLDAHEIYFQKNEVNHERIQTQY